MEEEPKKFIKPDKSSINFFNKKASMSTCIDYIRQIKLKALLFA